MTASAGRNTLAERFNNLNWAIITLLCVLACFGVVMHFSVADGSWAGMPLTHGARFLAFLALMIGLAMVNVRIWLAIAYPLYAVALVLLVGVELFGATRMGAQRWLDFGPVQIQPSEIMKVAIVLALARYYHHLDPAWFGPKMQTNFVRDPLGYLQRYPVMLAYEARVQFVPLVLIAAPTGLIMHQPDLGTAILVAGSGLSVMFLAGLRWGVIVPGMVAAAFGAVYAYFNILHQYQRDRINTFLDPTADPLGTGYHVLQSKIAIGSAGLFGHGYLKGPQSQLDFLPEKHTDFIFTMIVEEFGLFGAFVVLALFFGLIALTLSVGVRARTLFGRLTAAGVAVTIGLYVFINTAMVIGLIPVVGIPLPLLSFGGTAMLTVMIGLAIVLSIHLHRKTHSSSRGLLW